MRVYGCLQKCELDLCQRQRCLVGLVGRRLQALDRPATRNAPLRVRSLCSRYLYNSGGAPHDGEITHESRRGKPRGRRRVQRGGAKVREVAARQAEDPPRRESASGRGGGARASGGARESARQERRLPDEGDERGAEDRKALMSDGARGRILGG